MKRLLLQSAAFVRAARRHVKKNPEAVPALQATLDLLAADAFHPALKTHKLKGELAGSWATAPGTICESFSNSSGTKARRPSNCKRSGRTTKPISLVIAEPGPARSMPCL